jgi:hypothetical protein
MSYYQKAEVDIKEKSWVVSEIKQTLVNIYQVFVREGAQYTNATLGLGDPHVGKINYIASMYALYNICIQGFEADFTKNDIVNEKVGAIKIDDYRYLIVSGMTYSNEKLIFMGLILNKWLFRFGYFRLLSAETVYRSDVAKLSAQDEV